MAKDKVKLAGQKEYFEKCQNYIGASTPPAPSRSFDFRFVHDELAVLQNVSRTFLNLAVEPIAKGRWIVWHKFTKEITKYRNLSTPEQFEEFFKSKLVHPRNFGGLK